MLKLMRFVLLGLGALVVTAVWFVGTHRPRRAASIETADYEFRQLRARFVDELPLLDMTRRDVATRAVSHPGPVHTVHTLIFDTRGGQRLVRMQMPFWTARRLFARHGALQWLGQLTFLDDTEFDPEPIRLTWDDVRRHGPGLIADYRHPSGGQFLGWVD